MVVKSYKKINKDLTLYYKNFYPYTSSDKSSKKHLVTIGIGGNKGNMFITFKKLFLYFQSDKRVNVIKTSPILKNPPFGFTNQDYFYNAIIVLKTNLSPNYFLHYVLNVEKYFGRQRSFKNAPRTLDLDIIFYNNLKIDKPKLQIPHPKFQERESVMIPLRYII